MRASSKILLSLPPDLSGRFKALVPTRQRSDFIRHLLEDELKKREQQLYECALAVEQDEQLNNDLKNWDVTLNDGLTNDESW